ncbi:cytochrome P450 [Haliea atlantica]
MSIEFNFYDPHFYDNPRPLYRRLRDESPCHWSDSTQCWVLSRYEDVRNAAHNWKVFSCAAGGGTSGDSGEYFAEYPNLLMMDPPKHTAMRNFIRPLLSPARLVAMEDIVRSTTRDLLAPFEGADSMDLTADFAEYLPALMVSEILGIPREDAAALNHLVDLLADGEQPNGEERAKTSIQKLSEYYDEALTQRESSPPGDDLLYHLLQAVKQGTMPRNEAIGFGIMLSIAGAETTTKMIGNMAILLQQNPDQRRLLLESPELMDGAIEEAMRYNSTTHIMTRTLTADYELHGQALREGQMVALLYNSANNDERQFEDPDRFDITRDNQGRHLGFGSGLHACLGAPLARLEIKVALQEILQRWPNFSVHPEQGKRYVGPFTQGYRFLPMQLKG